MLQCYYCGIDIWKKRDPERQSVRGERKRPVATMDHVIPRSRAPHQGRHGGCSSGQERYPEGAIYGRCEHTAGVVPACESCNNEKGALTIDEYRVVLAFRYGWIQGVEYKFPGEYQ